MTCGQPGCDGELAGGFCRECGMAPPAPAAPSASVPAAPPSAARASSSSAGARRRSQLARAPRGERHRLGRGLVSIAPAPEQGPLIGVMAAPSVPERSRFCRCGHAVGRGRDGSAGRSEGFCGACGHPFSFEPKLAPGDVVAGQYEVVGCIAHGGQGWIYLARDRRVDDRLVVLKGLLNSGDEDAVAAALDERRFLAKVVHPNIVRIYNFAERDGCGYIVMEYVAGASLQEKLAARRAANGGRACPLPVAEAIAYVYEILPALEYLHGSRLLFCDFKPDNVMHAGDSVTLIDLGGAYRMDDGCSPVYGTAGYQAPEIAQDGPSVASDIFTVGRTLAALCVDLEAHPGATRHTLPEPADVALFAQFDSLYRFLVKATAADRDDRFRSAAEMRDQLYGVWCEVVAMQTGTAIPEPSSAFTADRRYRAEQAGWRLLPALLVAGDDPAAGYLAALAAREPAELVVALRAAPHDTVEVRLCLARAFVDARAYEEAAGVLDRVEHDDRREWRVQWLRGIALLAQDEPLAAGERFATVYRTLPGELAPKLALGLAAECAGHAAQAARWYEIVSRIDPGYVTASFGLARCCLASDDRAGAVAALDRVGDESASYADAQIAKVRCLLARGGAAPPTVADLAAAGAAIDELAPDGELAVLLGADVLRAALGLLEHDPAAADAELRLVGHPFTEARVRSGLERECRMLARTAPSLGERYRLVDEANRVRPRTRT